MTLLDRIGLRGRKAAPAPAAPRVEPVLQTPKAESSDVSNPAPWFDDVGWSTFSSRSRVKGLPPVSADTAQRHATVFSCCNVIAGDLAKVPLKLWQRGSGGQDKRVREHPAEYLLNVESVDGVAATVTRFALAYAFALRGVGLAWAPRDGAGELRHIEAVLPNTCTVQSYGRERFYTFEDGEGIRRRVPMRSMVHARYMALDGWASASPIQVAGESMGIALARNEAAARAATGGTAKAAIILSDDYESDEDRINSARRIKEMLTDVDGGTFPVLNLGEDIKRLDISAADAQLMAALKMDRQDICGIYRMPPSKLQNLDNGVKANGQQQAIDYLTDGLMHWSRLLEAQLALGLLTRGEREAGLFFRHDFKALMRPTTKEQFDAYKVAVGGPFLTPNEARDEVGMGPVPDGERLYPPSNMTREEQDDGDDDGAGDDDDDQEGEE